MRACLALMLFAMLAGPAAAGTVTDLAGRRVELPDTVERVILGEGRYIPALAILDRDDPVGRVVGMMGDYKLLDPASYARYAERFPAIDDIPRIGRTSAESFSLEAAIALKPQVAIFGIEGHGPGARAGEVIAALEAAGIAIVFVDFRHDPLANTAPSMELLGRVLGREAEAEAFLAVWRRELARVTERLAQARPPRPRVFLESRVGLMPGCCETMVRGMMADFVTAAGGDNLAAGIVPGQAGTISLELLLTDPPDVYIGTAIGSAQTAGERAWLALGAGVPEAVARTTLARSLERPGIADLDAIRAGRAHAVWHHFYNSPFNVAAVQAMAQWLHPELFPDLDPEALLAGMHRRFQPFELDGAYWVSLK